MQDCRQACSKLVAKRAFITVIILFFAEKFLCIINFAIITLDKPGQIVSVSCKDQPPEEEGDPQDYSCDEREHHRHQEINEECDEGCEAEDNYFDENDNEMGDQPGQEQLPLVQSDADCEEQREDEMQDGEEKHEGEKGAGVF